MSSQPSTLGLFVNKLIDFFEDLNSAYPEEKEIRAALESIKAAKRINPKLILDLFSEYVTKPLRDPILAENEEIVISFAKTILQSQFNDMSPALLIFDRHWPEMTESSRQAIWKHLKVLVLLSEKAKA
jgi:hypothetical protein